VYGGKTICDPSWNTGPNGVEFIEHSYLWLKDVYAIQEGRAENCLRKGSRVVSGKACISVRWPLSVTESFTCLRKSLLQMVMGGKGGGKPKS
jgi:hypothetical protein